MRFLIFLLFSPTLLLAQSQSKIQKIQVFEQKRYEALVKNDLAELAKMLAEDLVYTHSNTTVEHKSEYLQALSSKKYVFESFTTDSTEYHFLNRKTVIAAGIVRMKGQRLGKGFELKARFTAVYVRRKRHWKLAAWQTTKF